MSPSNSTRWCPTPEQLMILEEMYRGGIRSPNASQIQKITAHLSFYGKIQGKNVFYWFQNHKARERQKLRRKLTKQLYQQQLLEDQQLCLHQFLDHRNNSFSSNTSSPPALNHLSIHKSADYLRQGGVEGAAASLEMSNGTWKIDPPSTYEMQNCMMRTYGDHQYDWMMNMMRDAGHNFLPCCSSNNRPLKTLQLFPTTTPDVKDQQGTSSNPSPICSSTSPN